MEINDDFNDKWNISPRKLKTELITWLETSHKSFRAPFVFLFYISGILGRGHIFLVFPKSLCSLHLQGDLWLYFHENTKNERNRLHMFSAEKDAVLMFFEDPRSEGNFNLDIFQKPVFYKLKLGMCCNGHFHLCVRGDFNGVFSHGVITIYNFCVKQKISQTLRGERCLFLWERERTRWENIWVKYGCFYFVVLGAKFIYMSTSETGFLLGVDCHWGRRLLSPYSTTSLL